MIVFTHHKDAPPDIDGQTLCDLDLVSLGVDRGLFYELGDKIREEYSMVPDKKFNLGLVKLFRGFRSRPSIYYTEYFQKKYEKQSRSNNIFSAR